MYKYNIKATNIKLDDALYEYIDNKIGSLSKFIEGIDKNAQVMIEVGKPSLHHKKGNEEFYAEANVELMGRGRIVIRAESRQWELKLAIDELKDRLQLELSKFKGKEEVKYKRKVRIAKNLLRLSPITWIDWIKKKRKQ